MITCQQVTVLVKFHEAQGVEGLPALNRSIWFLIFPCLFINSLSQSSWHYCTDLSVASMRWRLKFSSFSLHCPHRIVVELGDAPQVQVLTHFTSLSAQKALSLSNWITESDMLLWSQLLRQHISFLYCTCSCSRK